jgi:UDP-N-acetylmuramate dehydrogenase
MPEWAAEVVKLFPAGRAHRHAALSSLTTWGVGGAAELLVVPRSRDEAVRAVHAARDAGVPCRVMGWGSNLLVSDRGIPGLVLRPDGEFSALRFSGTRATGEPAVGLPSLAREAARRGLSGVEFLVGIPGSLGGAVAVNAGAEGRDLAGIVESVEVLHRSGRTDRWSAGDMRFGYRYSRLLEEPALVLSVALSLREDEPEQIERRTRDLVARRRRQPGGRSAGSVFRNPEGDFAGRLLERCGTKGMRCGGARVPDEHANFILAEGETSAEDILGLIRRLQETVVRETGVLLVPEVLFAGFEEGDPALPRGARILREIR